MNQALSELLATAPWVEPVCRAASPHWQDLRQELFILLCTDIHDKAVKAMEGGYLEFMYIRCAHNLSKPKGKITAMFTVCEAIPEGIPEPEKESPPDNTDRLSKVAAALAGCDWYETTLFQMYAEGWSAREIHRRTRIPLRSVLAVINGVKERARNT